MIGRRLRRESLGSAPLAGLVLASDVRNAAGHIALGKGQVLADGDAARLAACDWEELHVLALEPGDVHESAAGERLARAVAGPGTSVGPCSGGQWPLRAVHRGVLLVNLAGLAAVNACADLSVYTLFDGQVVDADETVARAKIIPFAVPQAGISLGERRSSEHSPVVAVRGFQPRRVAALVQESVGERGVARFRAAFGEKVEWFGGSLDAPLIVRPDVGEVTRGLADLLASGPDLVVVAGSRTMDPLDPVFDALAQAGATMIRRGMPAHPGSLCWVARRADTIIVGMPSCGVFSQATVFDLLLTWIFADVPLDAQRLAAVGHGGFLTRDMAFRFPPYRTARDRGEVE